MVNPSIFFVKIPPLQQLCHVILKVVNAQFDFHLQVSKCRQLLSICPHAVASPHIDNRTLIDVIVDVEFYKKKLGIYCQKLSLKPVHASIAKSFVVESCVLYTLKFKLAPQWNEVGNILVANSDFLMCQGKLDAVNLDVMVRNGGEMVIKIMPYRVRLFPAKLENFGICPQVLEKFYEDPSYEIPECAINLQWCHVLPSMKKGQLVNVSRKISISGTSTLRDYDDLCKYWKCQYGYQLPPSAEDMIFCSVYFLQLSANLYTYPLICLRNRSIQFMPRCDEPEITKRFFYDLRQSFSRLCSFPLTYAPKACSVVNSLSIASQLKPGRPQNVRVTDLKIQQTKPDVCSRQVPNADVILSTQTRTGTFQKDTILHKVSGLCESTEKKVLLTRFPTNSLGKYIPVFACKKRVAVSSPKCNSLTTHPPNGLSQCTANAASTNLRENVRLTKKKVLTKEGNKQNQQKRTNSLSKKHNVGQVSSAVSNTQNELQRQNPQTGAKPNKHKFDQFFSSASTNSESALSKEFLTPKNTSSVSKLKKHNFNQLFACASSVHSTKNLTPPKAFQAPANSPHLPPKARKHKFDQLFSSASTNSESAVSKEFLVPRNNSSVSKSKKHNFEQIFACASSVHSTKNLTPPKAFQAPANSPHLPPKAPKHKFDQLFTSGSSNTQNVSVLQNVVQDAQSKPSLQSSKSQKHKFDQLFASASSHNRNQEVPQKTFQPPLPKKYCASKTCRFDSLFMPASKRTING